MSMVPESVVQGRDVKVVSYTKIEAEIRDEPICVA